MGDSRKGKRQERHNDPISLAHDGLLLGRSPRSEEFGTVGALSNGRDVPTSNIITLIKMFAQVGGQLLDVNVGRQLFGSGLDVRHIDCAVVRSRKWVPRVPPGPPI